MRNYCALILSTLFVCLFGVAQAVEYNPEGGFPIDKNVSVGRLDNGFTYYIT